MRYDAYNTGSTVISARKQYSVATQVRFINA